MWVVRLVVVGCSLLALCGSARAGEVAKMNSAGVLEWTRQPGTLTASDILCVLGPNSIGSGGLCNALGDGDITAVWDDGSGSVDALTAAAGDTFDAGAADSSKPCARGATLPGTCGEGDCFQDTDSGGSETYICTASNTWKKHLNVEDIDVSAELAAIIGGETGTGVLVFNNSPTIVTPTIASFANAGHDHTNSAGGGQLSITGATTGTLSIARGGTGQTGQTAAFDALAPTTTKGDLIVFNGSDNIRVGVGSDGQILTADAAEASGVKWAAAPGGGGGGPTDALYLVTTANGTLSAEKIITAGTAIDVTVAGGDGGTATVAWVPAEVADTTWGSGGEAAHTWIQNIQTGIDPILEFTNNLVTVSTPFEALNGGGTFTAAVTPVYRFTDAVTLNYTNPKLDVFHSGGTLTMGSEPFISEALIGFHHTMTLRNAPAATDPSGGLWEFGIDFSFLDRLKIIADTLAAHMIIHEGFTYGPQFKTENGGTLSMGHALGFSCVGTVEGGVTVDKRTCYRAGDNQVGPTTGTVLKQVGFHVENLTASVASIGFLNADTTVNIPRATGSNNPVSAGTAIFLDATEVQLTASGNTTMTVAPTILDPADTTDMNGQTVRLINADSTDSITLRDESDLTSSNLKLSAPRVTLGPGQTLLLTWNNTLGLWVEGDSAGNRLVNNATTGSFASRIIQAIAAPGSASTAVTTGLQASATTTSTASSGSIQLGVDAFATCTTTNTCAALRGVSAIGQNSGAGTATSIAGLYAGVLQTNASGTAGDLYAIYVAPGINLGTVTGALWGLYVDSDPSHFGGRVDVTLNNPATSGSSAGLLATYTTTATAATTAVSAGIRGVATTASNASAGSTQFGGDFIGTCASTNGCAAVTGVSGIANKTSTGTTAVAYGGHFGLANTTSGNITLGAAVRVAPPIVVTGSIVNAYAHLVEDSGGVYDYTFYSHDAAPVSLRGNLELRAGHLTQTETIATSGNGVTIALTANPVGGSETFRGINAVVATSGGAAAGNTLIASDGIASCTTSNGCTATIGVSGVANKTGTGTVATLTGGSFGVTNIAAGAATVAAGVYVAPALAITGTFGTIYGFWSDGTEPNRMDGPLGVGLAPASSVQFHTRTGSGNEVFRFETDTTGDDPRFYSIQSRGTTSGAASATFDLPIATDKVQGIEVHITARCTASAAGCTTGQGGYWITRAVYKNVGGTVGEVGETNSFTAQDLTTPVATPALTVSGTNARLTVTGLTNQALTWQATWLVVQTGS